MRQTENNKNRNNLFKRLGSNQPIKKLLPALISTFNLASALNFCKIFRKTNVRFAVMIMLILSMAALSIPQAQAAGTVSHPASHVTAGTFDTGDFTFPNNLFILSYLGVGTSSPRNELNVIGTGNFTTNLYVAEQQVCREDGTNCPAGAGEVGNVTGVIGAAPITSTGGATPEIGINMLGDLATTSPITGAAANIFPGTDGAKATIGVTVAKDIVTTSPLTVNGGANLNDMIIGTDADITIAIQDATTSQKGAVQLTDSTSTTSSTLAATATAVKSAYDLADSKLSSESDTLGTVADRGATTDKALTIDSNGDEQTSIGGDLTVDSGTLHVDKDTNMVGINDSTPTDTLDVDGNIQVSGVIHSGGDVIIRLGG